MEVGIGLTDGDWRGMIKGRGLGIVVGGIRFCWWWRAYCWLSKMFTGGKIDYRCWNYLYVVREVMS